MNTIICRAKVSDECYDGDPTSRQFNGEDEPMSDDGTWDGKTIVCDACYIELMPFTRSGAALNQELPEAISVYQGSIRLVRAHSDPQELVDKAKGWMEGARPGSPAHRSAEACMKMAEREVERRAACQD